MCLWRRTFIHIHAQHVTHQFKAGAAFAMIPADFIDAGVRALAVVPLTLVHVQTHEFYGPEACLTRTGICSRDVEASALTPAIRSGTLVHVCVVSVRE